MRDSWLSLRKSDKQKVIIVQVYPKNFPHYSHTFFGVFMKSFCISSMFFCNLRNPESNNSSEFFEIHGKSMIQMKQIANIKVKSYSQDRRECMKRGSKRQCSK